MDTYERASRDVKKSLQRLTKLGVDTSALAELMPVWDRKYVRRKRRLQRLTRA